MPEGEGSLLKLAILYNEKCQFSPSNKNAINKFVEAAAKLSIEAHVIDESEDFCLSEYHGLFIRSITEINNYAHNLAKVAMKMGLFVIDDPYSIRVCSNKVLQFYKFIENKIPIPKTLIIEKNNIESALLKIKKPYIIKKPLSSFSRGIYLVSDEYQKFADALLTKMRCFVLQEFLQTEFDWRIGVLNNEIIFACKYYMTEGSWKVIKHDRKGNFVDGESETLALDKVPHTIKYHALKTAQAIGRGLYGIDIKESKGNIYVIEINDNPNIDAGVEDLQAGDGLYLKIMRRFKVGMQERINRNKVFK